MLEIKNLSFTVQTENGPLDIIKDISLTVPDGKFIVITGPNGGGKSTLAKLIMGIETPTSGQILLDGRDITHMEVSERAKLGISYGFQQPPRFKGMKVRDLLDCAAAGKISFDQSCKYLTQVGLCAREYIDRDVDSSLSGGELKRIEIATILAKRGSMMIFDEPEAGIDLWSFSRLTATFESIHQNSTDSIIIISHQERIIRLADEIVLVSGGRITDQGPVEDIFPKILANTTGVCSYLEEA